MEKKTVARIIEAYQKDSEKMIKADAEKQAREGKKDTNLSKMLQRNNMMIAFLKTVPSDLIIDAESTPSDYFKLNAGSLTECILRYHMAKDKPKKIAKSGGIFDASQGCIDVEIKLSLNGSCYNTPIQEKSLVYLVNRDGIFMIKKADVETLAPKGKLPYKEWEGAKHIEWLERVMFAEVKK